jgi:hypothetical protein
VYRRRLDCQSMGQVHSRSVDYLSLKVRAIRSV